MKYNQYRKNKNIFNLPLLAIGISLLSACSSSNHIDSSRNQQNIAIKTNKPNDYYTKIKHRNLNAIYNKWEGTRYRFGGKTKQGIDCSAFTQTVFLDSFGIKLPRSTRGQKNVGVRINKSNLMVGDLVFFRNNHHVGVYIGNQKFIHSSSSQGVTISSLNESYWIRTYTQSRRVL